MIKTEFKGVEEALNGFNQWQNTMWGTFKDKMFSAFDKHANIARENAPTQDVKTKVTGGTNPFEQFNLTLSVNDRAATVSEFGHLSTPGPGQTSNMPATDRIIKPDFKGTITELLVGSAIAGRSTLQLVSALFFEEIETDNESIESKTLTG